MKNTICFLFLSFSFGLIGNSTAQENQQLIREGNKKYKENNFENAELNYRKGLEKNPKSVTGQYNLANSLYRQKKFDEAKNILDTLSKKNLNTNQKSQLFHNLGNNRMSLQDYEGAVNAYKQALKNNPNDNDTRYNLSYALEKLKQQQQKQQQQQKKEQEKEQQQNNDIKRQDADKLTEAMNREEKDLHKKKGKAATDYKPEKDW
jgi:Ca-activated chloride channel family protein